MGYGIPRPRCQECESPLDPIEDMDGNVVDGRCPQTCPQCDEHLDLEERCPNGCHQDNECLECNKPLDECECDAA